MDEATRGVAWAIAEAWWRKTHRQPSGELADATTSTEYADQFWQGFVEEANAALAAMSSRMAPPSPAQRIASDRFV